MPAVRQRGMSSAPSISGLVQDSSAWASDGTWPAARRVRRVGRGTSWAGQWRRSSARRSPAGRSRRGSGVSPSSSAISVPNVGRPVMKARVPSIGSSTQRSRACGRSRPNSSPRMPCSGKRSASTARIACSALRSAIVTGERSDLGRRRSRRGRMAGPPRRRRRQRPRRQRSGNRCRRIGRDAVRVISPVPPQPGSAVRRLPADVGAGGVPAGAGSIWRLGAGGAPGGCGPGRPAAVHWPAGAAAGAAAGWLLRRRQRRRVGRQGAQIGDHVRPLLAHW